MSQQQAPSFTIGGRLVAGDVVNGNSTDSEGRPLTIKNGPNAGQPRTEWYVALAVPKNGGTDWKQTQWGQLITQVAVQSYPSLFDQQGNLLNPAQQFAFKISDGDSQIPNSKGNKPCDREGWPGHWVVHFANGFAPKLYKMLENDPQPLPLNPGEEIKTGYYAEIFANVKGNNATGNQSGVFLNMSMVCLRGYGPEIASGPDVSAAGFGQSQIAGASSQPVGGFGQPDAPAPQVQNTPPPAIEPATDLVTPPPVPAAEPKFTYNGQTKTMAEWLAMPGWTEALVNQHCTPA